MMLVDNLTDKVYTVNKDEETGSIEESGQKKKEK